MKFRNDLTGRTALVTGGSSGIGEAIARDLAAAGAKVAINCVSHLDAAQKVAAEIGPDAVALQADVSDSKAVEAMFQQVDRRWHGLDILINNAGIDGERALAWEADESAWQKVIAVNLFGAFFCARQALRRMVPQKRGVIVNITSVHEEIAWSGYSAYCTAKAGEAMLTKTLAQEAAPHGVRVLAVAPGAVKTPINQSVWQDPAGLKDLERKIPLGRIGETQDIASAVTFLVSDSASYITARTIFVDGGMTDFPDFAHGG
ncbi:MAG TPA: glucose 1-dehydrogenase [Opitutaceae bacterium]|jgi:NAD(P)-dependent dehydrogenase (short-subunit alcohol dehydrogenase family)